MSRATDNLRVPVRIVPFAGMRGDAAAIRSIDEIFFEASNTKTFADDIARAQFRQRWLGRYLDNWPQWASVAVVDDDVAGYLVGCTLDPATLAMFDDLAYVALFATLSARYPAHLHVNVADRFRGHGIGARLVEHFVSQISPTPSAERGRKTGAAGVHVVTSRGARNVRFYGRCGFEEAGHMPGAQSDLVFLARALP